MQYFNPRTHRGVRLYRFLPMHHQHIFQSTHPSWGATIEYLNNVDENSVISIHAPIVGCDNQNLVSFIHHIHFNPRTHRGVRPLNNKLVEYVKDFNPRTHRGVRPWRINFDEEAKSISIHAPIVGCDAGILLSGAALFKIFQSTHPSWGATMIVIIVSSAFSISIHAPIVGCDCKSPVDQPKFYEFQSTHPSWGATL